MCAAMKNQKVQKYLAVITIFASTTPASGAVLKFMAQRSLAAVSAQTDPHCSSGIVSLKKFPDDKGTHSCCAGYCGACNDYDSCKSIRGQASDYACCASKVYERRCGNAPANVCLKTCSESTPPCIMDIDVDSMGTPKVKDVKGVPDCGEVVPHVRSMHANALDKGDTLTDIHKTITQLDEAASYAKDAQAKARADIEDPDIPAEYKTKIEAEAKHAQTVIEFAEKHKQKTKEAGKAVNAVESWKGVPKEVKLKVKEVSLQAAKDDKEALGSLGKATGLHQDAYLAVAKIAQKEAAAVEAEALKKRAAADAAARKAAAKAAEAAKKAAEEKAVKEAAEAAAAAKKAAEEAAAAAKAAEEAAAKAKKEAEEKARRAGMTPAWQQPSETWSEWPKNPWGSKYWLSKTLDSCGTLLEKQSFSLSLWANLRKLAFGTEAYLIATHGPKGARSYLQFGIHDPPSGNPGIFFRMRNGCAVRAPIKKNVEHHYVATFDAATMTQKIFFDGKLLQTCTAEIPFQCPSKDLYVGCWAPQGAPPESGCEYHMVGDMRATKIFSGKALTSNDIQDEFKRGPVASESTEEKTEKTEKKKSEVSFRAEAGLCRNNVDGKWHLGTFGAYCGIPGPKRIRKDGKWVFTDAECKKACADYEPCKAANVQKYSPCELFTGQTSGKPDDCPEGFAPGPPSAPEGNPKPDEYFSKEYPPTDTAGTGSFCYIKESGAAAAATPATFGGTTATKASPLTGIPKDFTSWLSADEKQLTLSGTTVTAVSDRNPSSSIKVFGSPTFSASDGFKLQTRNHFQMNNVIGFGTWTVFLVFKTTCPHCGMLGADPGGCGNVDTEIGFGWGGNRHFFTVKGNYNPTVKGGELGMSTHSMASGCAGGINGGTFTSGTKYNDGAWHWGEFYGGKEPKYTIHMNDGKTFENTNVHGGWMRDGLACFVGRDQLQDFDGYIKEAIFYNRELSASEKASVHAFLDKAVSGNPWE